MPHLIHDYLQTQALALPPDAVAAARAAAYAVLQHAQTVVEPDILWPTELHSLFTPDTEQLANIRQIFLALDAFCTRLPLQAAAVYLLHPDNNRLIRLAQHGRNQTPALPLDGSADAESLAARSARTGWLNIADDVAAWQSNGDLHGHQHGHSQAALPVCGTDGHVFGVLYLEHAQTHAFSPDTLADWVGLTLALHPLLAHLNHPEPTDLP